MRHPFCRYDYSYRPAWPLERYALERQAEIVRHVLLHRHGHEPAGAPPPELIEPLLRFERG